MKIGINTVSMRFGDVVDGTLLAESLGYDSIWHGEHILLANEMKVPYPVQPQPYGPQEFIDIFTLLAYLAAKTKRIRLATGVLVLPLRAPIHAARAIVGMDILSGGRFDLGVGVGWNQEEFDAVGVDIRERGARTDEMLEMLQMFWSSEDVKFRGRHYDIPSAPFDPKPLTKPRPRVFVGGFADAALRRAAKWDGWYGGGSVELVERLRDKIRGYRVDLGLDQQPFETVILRIDAPSRSELESYFSLGVDRMVVTPWGRDYSNALKCIETYAKEIGLTPQ